MGRLDPEARMAIKALAERGTTRSEIARLLGVTEGAVRHHLRRMAAGAADGRSLQPQRAESQAEAIEHWRSQQGEGGVNLAALHGWLRREHGYEGSLRSVQRYWRRAYPAPAVRARRRVETPAGAQAQVDWAHFPGLLVGGEVVDLVALHMVLSWSRREAIVWARSRDALSWQSCHTGCFGCGFRRRRPPIPISSRPPFQSDGGQARSSSQVDFAHVMVRQSGSSSSA